MSSVEGWFSIFMMDGIDDIPAEDEPVYITGLGTEDNGNETCAQQMLRQGEGIYQAFTELKAVSTVENTYSIYLRFIYLSISPWAGSQ